MCFWAPESPPRPRERGGGGGNSLISDNSQKEDVLNEENQTWENPIYKTYEEYFTCFDISKETISTNDFTGTGTERDPFIIYSTRGFLYLSNSTLSGVSLTYKFIELECDIILNDEVFDENGKPLNGDGEIFEWKPIKANYININGHGHSITGLFIKGDKFSHTALFGSSIGCIFENLVCEDFYLETQTQAFVFTFASDILSAQNVVVRKGTIRGTTIFGGGFSYSGKNFENCISNIKIYGKVLSGFIYSCDNGGSFKNCINYCDLKSDLKDGSSVGFVRNASKMNFSNCTNYGDMTAIDFSSGFVYAVSEGKIEYCKNYGKISGRTYVSAIMSRLSKSFCEMSHCENYGDLYASTNVCGQMVGSCDNSSKLSISNCKVFSKSGFGLVGTVNLGENQVFANDVYAEVSSVGYGVLIGNIYVKSDVIFKNIQLEIFNKGEKVSLFGHDFDDIQENIHLQNLEINVYDNDLSNFSFFSNKKTNSTIVECKSMLVTSEKEKIYYGNDVSGFFVNFRTGEIGIMALEGKGFLYGKVTEEDLINKGYTKKAI